MLKAGNNIVIFPDSGVMAARVDDPVAMQCVSALPFDVKLEQPDGSLMVVLKKLRDDWLKTAEMAVNNGI